MTKIEATYVDKNWFGTSDTVHNNIVNMPEWELPSDSKELRKLQKEVSWDALNGFHIPPKLKNYWEKVLYKGVDIDLEIHKAWKWAANVNHNRVKNRDWNKTLCNTFFAKADVKGQQKKWREERDKPVQMDLSEFTRDIAKEVPKATKKRTDIKEFREWKKKFSQEP